MPGMTSKAAAAPKVAGSLWLLDSATDWFVLESLAAMTL